MNSDFANWFVGFADGEGCFVIAECHGRRQSKHKPVFALALRDDDADIIFAIQEQFGFGTVQTRVFTSPGSHNGIGWNVGDKQGLMQLVQFFNKHPLRSKKARDFRVWCEAVIEYQKDCGVRNIAKMEYLYTKLKLVRKYELPEDIEDFVPGGAQLEFWDLNDD